MPKRRKTIPVANNNIKQHKTTKISKTTLWVYLVFSIEGISVRIVHQTEQPTNAAIGQYHKKPGARVAVQHLARQMQGLWRYVRSLHGRRGIRLSQACCSRHKRRQLLSKWWKLRQDPPHATTAECWGVKSSFERQTVKCMVKTLQRGKRASCVHTRKKVGSGKGT